MAYEPREYWSSLHDREAGSLTAVGYPALGVGFNRVAYRRRISALRKVLRRLFQDAELPRVLEGAVGVGAYAPVWRERAVREWVGVDISPTAIDRVSKAHPEARFAVVDLASDPSTTDGWAELGPPASFDVVTAIDVLYHLTDDTACLRAIWNLARFVRPGGALIVSDVFVQDARVLSAHVKRRPMAFYSDALASAGFREADREPVFAVLGDPVRRPRFHLADFFTFNTWRVLQKAVREAPEWARSPLGTAAAWTMFPLDMIVCRSGATRGINLELAAFRKR